MSHSLYLPTLSLPRVGFGLPASLMHQLCLTRLKSSSHSNVIDEFGVIHCLERECRSQACNRRWRCHSISPARRFAFESHLRSFMAAQSLGCGEAVYTARIKINESLDSSVHL